MMQQIKILLISLLLPIAAFAQANTDSLQLSYGDYLGIVLENHPLAKQAQIQGETGGQYLRTARGAFDPYLAANWDAKQFSGKNYWQIFESSLRVPTWFGTEFYAGWNSANGSYLNASETLPQGGQAALGLQINLGKGLFIDERRAELQKAKAYAQMTLAQQRQMLLDLTTDATYAYWNWAMDFHNRETYQEAYDLAEQRFEAIRASFQRGEEPAIDTLEAYIQVQNRLLNLSEANVNLAKSARFLNNFIWSPNGEPVEFIALLAPASKPNDPILKLPQLDDATIDSLILNHPQLIYYELKGDQLQTEERWRKEQLKPDLVLKYQALTAAPSNNALVGDLDPAQNLKWGIKFSFPLFLRKQRSYLQLARLAIQQNQYDQEMKQNELRNKLGAYQVQILGIEQQIALSRAMVINYERMVSGEIEKFQMGESSIFLINTREQKLIDAKLKLNALQSKLPIAIGEANRAAGGFLIGG